MKFSGKYGEYRVLAKLLERDMEAYLALRHNQSDYDITVITSAKKVVRIQVKTAVLANKATNNPFDIDREYDFLVAVIIEPITTPNSDDSEVQQRSRFFILTRDEAFAIKGTTSLLGLSQQRNKVYQVKDALLPFENQWSKIRDFSA
ncbi:MAG TPA: hypothetical protein PLD03_15715 [Thiomonas arsenitoxydans]|nr:hypothetical protein [Thiomonas arsenitoxydans]